MLKIQLIWGGKLWFITKTQVNREFPVKLPEGVSPLLMDQYIPEYVTINSITAHPDLEGYAIINDTIEVPYMENTIPTALARKHFDSEKACYEAARSLNNSEANRFKPVIKYYQDCLAALEDFVEQLDSHKA